MSNSPFPPPVPGSAPSFPPSYPGVPGGQPYGYRPYEEPARVSGIAVASLICSLIVCIPFLTSAVGVVLGIAGIVVTRNPRRTGKLLAIFGLLVGLVGIAGWSYASYVGWNMFGRPYVDAVSFAQYMAEGDTASAAKYTAPPFDPATLPGLTDHFKSLGKFQNIVNPKGQKSIVNGQPAFDLNGTATFAKGSEKFELQVVRTPDGWRLTRFAFVPLLPTLGTTTGSSGAASPGDPGSIAPEVPAEPMTPAVPAEPTPPAVPR